MIAARVSRLLLLAAMGLVLGCKHAPKPVDPATVQQTLHVRIEADEHTNGGNIFYSIVRAMDAKTAPLAESYEQASAHLFAGHGDSSVLKSFAVIPGQKNEFDVQGLPTSSLWVYFFFTQPGPRWRAIVPPPWPKSVVFELHDNDIGAVNASKEHW
ncbi:MAG: hypothetical protein JWN04_6625 [Myxococcaceae bacterium]|nr:hypothetical protein [Myxococcaceae bacterium]